MATNLSVFQRVGFIQDAARRLNYQRGQALAEYFYLKNNLWA